MSHELCKDCKHNLPPHSTENDKYRRCSALADKPICQNARMEGRECGVDGKLWEAKD